MPSSINHFIFAVFLVRDGSCFPDSEDKPDMTGKKYINVKMPSFVEKFSKQKMYHFKQLLLSGIIVKF